MNISSMKDFINAINRNLHVMLDQLMQSLAAGKEGFAYLSQMLKILLQTLLQDETAEVLLFHYFLFTSE